MFRALRLSWLGGGGRGTMLRQQPGPGPGRLGSWLGGEPGWWAGGARESCLLPRQSKGESGKQGTVRQAKDRSPGQQRTVRRARNTQLVMCVFRISFMVWDVSREVREALRRLQTKTILKQCHLVDVFILVIFHRVGY